MGLETPNQSHSGTAKKVRTTMAPKISFSALVRKTLSDNGGTLLPEVYTKAGYCEALCGVDAWTFLDRIDAVIAGKEAEGEVPDFLKVAHRGRKAYGVDFKELEQPLNPNVNRRASYDPTKPQTTTNWPAIAVMSDTIRSAMEKANAAEERARLATGEAKEWFESSDVSDFTQVMSAKPGAKEGQYIVTVVLDTLGTEGRKAQNALDATKVSASVNGSKEHSAQLLPTIQ